MAKPVLLYGDEAALLEEQKQVLLSKYEGELISVYSEEEDPMHILSALQEDSLFGELRVLCLVNLPIFKKSNKNVDAEWLPIYEVLKSYNGENPVLLLYHDTIDKRQKHNTSFLTAVTAKEFKRLNEQELWQWTEGYLKRAGYVLTPDGRAYLQELVSLWQDVPVSFLKTEFDRYFLQLGEQKQIDRAFLQDYSSDYGAKNIFSFKEALLDGDGQTLLRLFPFMLSYKEIDRAMAYVAGQLRLQLVVCQCYDEGMTEAQVQDFFKRRQSTVKSYPIKLAYRQARRVSVKALETLLEGLYDCMRRTRQGEGDMLQFRDLCLAYSENARSLR